MPEPPQEAISFWMERLAEGDERAEHIIFKAYYDRLVSLVDRKRVGANLRLNSSDDVAQSAMKSFMLAAQKGKFPDLADRDSLWRLLVKITTCKIVAKWRHETAEKRGGGKVQDEAAIARAGGEREPVAFDEMLGDQLAELGREQTPDLIVQLEDEIRRGLDALPDDELRQIALMRLEGCTNREIKERLGFPYEAKVERKITLIREVWLQVSPPDFEDRA